MLRFDIEPGDLLGPGAVEVNVHDSVEALHKWAAENGDTIEPGADAYTTDFPDADHPVTAQLHFGGGSIPLALVAHEVTHAALAIYNRHRSRFIDIVEHTEELPEWIGNLTAVVWYSLQEAGVTEDV